MRVLVALFVAFDVVLVFGVIRHVNQSPPPSDIVSSAASPTATAQATESKQTDTKFNAATSATMSLANDQTLLFAVRGKCKSNSPGKLVVSTDGGTSTQQSDTGLQTILAVDVVTRSELRIVGTDSGCNVQKLTSSDGGDTWQPGDFNDLWYPAPDDAKKVIAPDGPTEPGCIVTSVSQIGNDFARVSCSNGAIRGTGNGGDKWVALGRLDNVRVAKFTTFNAGYALAVYQGCAAQAFKTRDGGRSWAPGGCITGEPAQAIAANDTGLVAVVQNAFYGSDTSGKDWKQP